MAVLQNRVETERLLQTYKKTAKLCDFEDLLLLITPQEISIYPMPHPFLL